MGEVVDFATRKNVNLGEITNRVAIAANHPDAATRRQAKQVLADDAATLVEVAKQLWLGLAQATEENQALRTALADHATVIGVVLERNGRELRVPQDWFDAYELSGGWITERIDGEIVFRLVTDEEAKAMQEAANGQSAGPDGGPEGEASAGAPAARGDAESGEDGVPAGPGDDGSGGAGPVPPVRRARRGRDDRVPGRGA